MSETTYGISGNVLSCFKSYLQDLTQQVNYNGSISLLAMLFNAKYVHGYLATPLMTANILSIPKDYRKNLADSNNYRGIALCSSLSNLLDVIVLKRNDHAMKSNKLQFAFKEGHSTVMCSYVVKEVVRHYLYHEDHTFMHAFSMRLKHLFWCNLTKFFFCAYRGWCE